MPTTAQSELFRRLPSVDELLRSEELKSRIETNGLASVTDAARRVLENLRSEIASGNLDSGRLGLALNGVDVAIRRELDAAARYSLRRVINATGVILHTNLGRAPLSEAALEHIRETAGSYSNLEFDLATGERGKRDIHVDRLFRQLMEKELGEALRPALDVSTIVVNNNAAAVLLALNTLAEDGEAIVSRGELVEIGGSFRIPDVMAKSGATLREVGTTNRTRISDYESAINEKTRLILRVHRSNFEISGFTEQPSLAELSELARRRGLVLMDDLGSGALFDLRSVGVGGEPNVFDSLRSSVDVVAYSGDKLLGGPQAGMLTGRADLIAHMRANSLFRALRVDKLILAALEATLMAYVKSDHDSLPLLRMMRLSKADIGRRAEALAVKINAADMHAELIDGESLIGGGAAPSSMLPTKLVAIRSKSATADQLMKQLRESDPPIIARIGDGQVLLDLRTVSVDDEASILKALSAGS